MPERPAAQLYAALERRINGLRQVRQSGERALTAAVLRDRELNHLYESTFLNLVRSFDAFQEELFYSSILGHSEIVTVRSILPFRNRAEATRFVEASERAPFLTWSRVRDSIDRAKRFLVGGRPFSRFERRDRDASIHRTTVVVRNAIAHRSGSAWEEFLKLPMPGHRAASKRPATYLRQVVGANTQHENLCDEVLRLAKALSAQTDLQAKRYLLAERPYRSGDSVNSGSFRCVGCGTVALIVAGRHELPRCGTCGTPPCPVCGNVRKSEFERM